MIDFGGADERRIQPYVLLPIKPCMAEGDFDELSDGMADSGGDDVVIRDVLLQHHPHRADVITRKAPIALRIEVAERKGIGQAEFDLRDAVRDFAGNELQAASRRLMVEEDAGDGKEVVALAIVYGD